MAIQSAGGTIINTTFVSDGTRADMHQHLVDALEAAGWTFLSGEGTSDVLIKSAVTPSGLYVCARIYDPGSGNCVRINLCDAVGGAPTYIAYMLPVSAKAYQIIANRYQFLLFSAGAGEIVTARYFVAAGVPWVPDFVLTQLSIMNNGWMNFTGSSDTDTTDKTNFRVKTTTIGPWNSHSNSALTWNGSVSYNNGGAGLSLLQMAETDIATHFQWIDGSLPVFDSLIGYGSPLRWFGQIWDSVIITGYEFETGSLITLGANTFQIITHNNSVGTLAVKVA